MGSGAPVKLNLGCGSQNLEGFVNHDLIRHSDWVDVAWDLNELPWPWEDDQFEMVIAASVLEHLYHNLLTSMNELWRITEQDGLAVVKLPYWKAEISWNDLTHIHRVGLGLMDQLDPRTKRGHQYWFYTRRKWAIEEKRFNAQRTSIIWKLRKRPLDWRSKNGQD